MYKHLILALLLLIYGHSTHAQHNTPQNKNWRFGTNAGLNFNSGVPVLSPTPTSHFFPGGSAQVSDASGNLLFYTNGKTVYDRLGAIMPHGDSIVSFPAGTGIYTATIIPVIGNSNQYYIFSLERGNIVGLWHGKLAYSIVDMSLNGGQGAVLPCVSGIVIDSLFNETMLTIPDNSCTMWVVCHKRENHNFSAFPVTGTGVGAAVVSTTSTCTGCYSGGGMKASPNGTKISTANLNKLQLHDFDPLTGIVSNTRLIDTFPGGYDQEFSPDGTKLYAQQMLAIPAPSGIIAQLDISLPTPAAIMGSRTVIATDLMSSFALKLAPDGKIYLPDYDQHYLNCINNPNAAGTACGYSLHSVNLSPNTAGLGLPAVYNNYPSGSGTCPTVTITPCPTETINVTSPRPISVSPNPGNGIYSLMLTPTLGNPPGLIRVFNITGSKIYEGMASAHNTINISAQPPGIYLLTVTTGNEQNIIKLVKE